MAAREYFYVVPNGGQWQLSREKGVDATFYTTKENAIQAGRKIARDYGAKHGVNSGLRIQKVGGGWDEERSYGDDPFPPKG